MNDGCLRITQLMLSPRPKRGPALHSLGRCYSLLLYYVSSLGTSSWVAVGIRGAGLGMDMDLGFTPLVLSAKRNVEKYSCGFVVWKGFAVTAFQRGSSKARNPGVRALRDGFYSPESIWLRYVRRVVQSHGCFLIGKWRWLLAISASPYTAVSRT